MDLTVPDTLAQVPRRVPTGRGRPVALYVCGPTVYDQAHVGHARTYLYFDVARRFLEGEGRRVRHVMNVTDFEDKIDARAAELGIGWRQLARRAEREFFVDLDRLAVLRPHVRPRASAFVPRMVEIARRLERTGRVTRTDDEWTYTPPRRPAGANFPTDRQLARHAVREPGHPFPTRGEAAGAFMVWRRQSAPRPAWSSRWGAGIPGWHLECYAMAERYLGLPVDLHGGGTDLIFPHHFAENEIALALRGTRFSQTFLHTAFVLLAGRKMSKSTRELVPIRSALEGTEPSVLRWYLLSRPLTQRLDWDPNALARSAEDLAMVRAALRGRAASTRGSDGEMTALAEGVRRDLAAGLAVERALRRLVDWSERDPTRRRGSRGAESRSIRQRAIRSIEQRTGLRLR
jgi:cysteinyl-tRNA synthetase